MLFTVANADLQEERLGVALQPARPKLALPSSEAALGRCIPASMPDQHAEPLVTAQYPLARRLSTVTILRTLLTAMTRAADVCALRAC